MKIRFIALATFLCLMANFVAVSAADTRGKRGKRIRASRLVTLLPASDGIIVFDSKRFLNESLPGVLAANQQTLSEIMRKLNETANRTGIDLRKFDEVAVGINIKQVAPGNTDFDPVAIVSGDINAGTLIAVAKLASSGTYREEKVAGRTVYVIAAKDVLQKTSGVTVTNSKITAAMDRAVIGLKDVAVAAFDQNSLVLGSYARVKETLEARTHPGTDLTSLLNKNPTAILNFAAKTPEGLDGMLPLGKDMLGDNLRSIQYVSGSLDIAATGATLAIAARTAKPEQAASLRSTIDGLRAFGGLLAGSKRADQQVYARMVKNVKVGNIGSDVTIDLVVPQADIDTLISGVK
ncbi:MAG TPA: hypothetical protein VGO43_13220 [Pyrinomonadaceae bacterium]|nr:hypothetical protein [Pyrinomonadaceae bacterium]